jgi:hypothetical protein
VKPIGKVRRSIKAKLWFSLVAAAGALLIFFATARYGVGLSPDSVGYIRTARTMLNQFKMFIKDGSQAVMMPPLYPALLALFGGIFRADPLALAHIVNALLYGMIIYLSGLLAYRYMPASRFRAPAMTLFFFASAPLFKVSVMAWSEPLFILFLVSSLLCANSYQHKKDISSLFFLAVFVAMSSITRYIGIVLIIWGAFVIFLYAPKTFRKRLSSLVIYISISITPLGLWVMRNFLNSGTAFGPRTASQYTFWQNVSFTFNTLMKWFIPRRITEQTLLLAILFLAIGVVLGFSITGRQKRKNSSQQGRGIVAAISAAYIGILIITSTTTAYDRISDRLLAPMYIPISLAIFVLVCKIVESYRERYSKKIVNTAAAICLAAWLIYPVSQVTKEAISVAQNGRGYGGKMWSESQTVKYLVQNREIENKVILFSNGPDITYILANCITNYIPRKTRFFSPAVKNDIARLWTNWPEGSDARIVWFDRINRSYLMTIDELRVVADIELNIRFDDGAIYSLSRK